MRKITVKTLKGFDNQGTYVGPGETITVDANRALDLRLNGLIEDHDVKNSPAPDNKQAPAPANKAAPKPKPADKPKAD